MEMEIMCREVPQSADRVAGLERLDPLKAQIKAAVDARVEWAANDSKAAATKHGKDLAKLMLPGELTIRTYRA